MSPDTPLTRMNPAARFPNTHRLTVWLATAFAALLLSCSDEPPSSSELPTCSRIPQSLDECFVGEFVADCGGEPGPTFACDLATSACFWFAGACVPTGFLVSTCPSDDICCHDNWPFTEPVGSIRLYYDFFAYGLDPWTTSREMTMVVEEDTDLEPTPTASFDCNGAFADGEASSSPCGEPTVSLSLPGTLLVGFQPPLTDSGWSLLLEADLRTMTARSCQRRFHDTPSIECPMVDPVCAADGVLRLNSIPLTAHDLEDVHGTVSAGFNGVQVTAAF